MNDIKLPMVPHCRNYRWRPGHGCKATGGACEPITQGEAAIRACPSFVAGVTRETAKATAKPDTSAPCVYLGESTGEVSPTTCCGQEEIPIYQCDVHGTCTLDRQTPDVKCCGNCSERSTVAAAADGRAIPKVFHRVWLGDKPMPTDFRRWGERWLDLHPGWEMYTWTDKNLKPLRVGECKTWEQARNHSQRSDVVRFLALLFYGGVYIDTDVEPVKNIEPLLAGQSFVAGREDASQVCTAVIASAPQHPVMQRAMALLNSGIPANAPKSWTGPPVLTQAARGAQTILGPEVFYPYHWTEPERRRESFPDAFTVHHWAGSWQSREWWPSAYENVHGWFDYADVYDAAIDAAKDGDSFVEVGSWMGKSAAYMALQIRESGKKIRFTCVDPWQWTAESGPSVPAAHEIYKSFGKSIREIFDANIAACDVSEFVRPMQMPSVQAARKFANGSLAFVFIDGDHLDAAADIAAWWPKIKRGGALAGHDIDMDSVARDVQASGIPYERVSERCWIARKT